MKITRTQLRRMIREEFRLSEAPRRPVPNMASDLAYEYGRIKRDISKVHPRFRDTPPGTWDEVLERMGQTNDKLGKLARTLEQRLKTDADVYSDLEDLGHLGHRLDLSNVDIVVWVLKRYNLI